jgi:hypothetical protein
MNKYPRDLINSYRQIREAVEWESWFLGLYPARNTPKWFEKLKKYRELKAKKEDWGE